ncbi:hypothetical protein LPJ53_002003 [Coemansia erecta]|uniref:WD40 repeat-like protein n=1 Tax=Coemansia erecta TaxID=147472 RepID=A0A9W8CTH1_9FUNG|nr:hypothetical protein LPJ53_002003 [Coemansia erecta]
MSTSPAFARAAQPTVEIPSEGRDTRSPFAGSSASAVSRTPSAVDFPGAFSTRPKAGAAEAAERMSLVPKGMKTRVTEAVGGGLANVVGGVYNLVSYVNPLGGSSSSGGGGNSNGNGNSAADAAKADGSTSPATAASSDGSTASSSPAAMLLQAPSAGTSVAADLDEQCLADANADNPESNRPPTPTKASFTRMLRFPTPGDDAPADRAGTGSSGGPNSDPVSRNVSQRTGHKFLPGAEERRRYMRRVERAPRLDDSSQDEGSSSDDNNGGGGGDQLGESSVDGWRFVTPRTKRINRRALWRLFLAQEITPAVYDELPVAHDEEEGDARRSGVWAMEFSTCGRYLAAGGRDGVVRVWRLAAFAREQARKDEQMQEPAARPPAMVRMRTAGHRTGASASDADSLAFANSAPVARAAKHLRSFSMGTARPLSAHSSAAAAAGAGAADASDARAHPLHAYELLEPVPLRSYAGHTADVLSLSWSKNGFLLSASADRTVRLWHPQRPECLCTFRHRDIVTSVAFSPRDDRLFVSGSLDCRLRLWDIPARGVRLWTSLPDGQMVTAVGFAGARGDLVVAGTYRGMCVFYSTHDLSVQGRMHARSSRGRNAQGSKITGFAYAPPSDAAAAVAAGHRLLVSSNDSRLRMFLTAERQLGRKYKGHANASSQAYARLSADARYIVSGSEDHNVYVWPVAQDNAASVATHPAMDHIRRGHHHRHGHADASRPQTAQNERAGGLLGSLFRRARASSQSKTGSGDSAAPPPASAGAADPAVDPAVGGEWESLDGRVEEKSIYEYFAAHDAPVSQALFAPLATLQYLADHGDAILSRPKLRRTSAMSGDVENVCRVNSDGSFVGPVPKSAMPLSPSASSTAVAGAAQRVEDTTAIIVSADVNGNIRVFRKDINAVAMPTPPPAASAAAAAEEDAPCSSRASSVMVRSRPTSMRRPPLLTSPASESQLQTQQLQQLGQQQQQHVQPASLRGSPSLWSRLGRRVSQRRTSGSFFAHVNEPQGSASDRADAESATSQPSNHREAGDPDAASCQYCGHTRLIEFAVAQKVSEGAPAAAKPSSSSNLLVCEKCKRVKNMI